MNSKLLVSVTLAAAAASQLQADLDGLFYRDTLSVGGGEIASYDAVNNVLYGTDGSAGLEYAPVHASDLNASFGNLSKLDFSGSAYFASNFAGLSIDGISSVAIDPAGRNFGVASVIFDNSGGMANTGAAVIFDTSTKSILTHFDTGFHPDMVTFSPNGSNILLANEGDNENPIEIRGSITNIDVSGVTGAKNFAGVAPVTTDFSAPIGNGDFLGVRDHAPASGMNTPSTTPSIDRIEPEYISVSGNTAFITLQENNAIAKFDITTNTFDAIHNLGTIQQTVDTSDRDNLKVPTATVDGMPMPDAVSAFAFAGKKFYVTANEGDFRDDDADRIRVKDLSIADGVLGALDPAYAATLDITDNGLGRLRVSANDGDTDGDGDIDAIRMPGTRSLSVWDENGNLLYDTEGLFEAWDAANNPDFYNWDDDDGPDKRSDDKGPETEGVAVGEHEGDIYAFAINERSNSVFMFKLIDDSQSDFEGDSVVFIDAIKTEGSIAPESVTFVNADDSPSGVPLLFVAYEDSHTWDVFVLPEPSAGGLFGLVALLLARRRR